MKVVEVYQDGDLPLMTHCRMCNKYFEVEWTVGWPYHVFCSPECSHTWNTYEKEGWPEPSDYEFKWWVNWSREQAKWKPVEESLEEDGWFDDE